MKKIYYTLLLIALVGAYQLSNSYLFVSRANNAPQIKELARRDQSRLSMQMNLPEQLQAREYAIVGGGLLRMPEEFRRVDLGDASVVIVHGTDYKAMTDYLQQAVRPDSRQTVIITSLAMKRIMLENDDRLFSRYLENYKKSGDIFSDRGSAFYYMDQIQFSVKDNLEGLVISFPVGFYFSKVKNYGLAHLIENDFSVQGFENPIRFLETINFPKPGGFSGTFEELIQLARKEYHEKYLANILGIDHGKGLVVSKELLPFLQPRKQDKHLPLFTVLRLSKNVYFSGLVSEQ